MFSSIYRSSTRSAHVQRHAFRRLLSASSFNPEGLRSQIATEIKTAMKARDTVTSTTLRSVMSEINAADKVAGSAIPPSAIGDILRKSMQRRTEAAVKFVEAKRDDLAEKEQKEADILAKLLPPLLSAEAIDAHLQTLVHLIPSGADPRKVQGAIFKEFYAKVDKSSVDPMLLKQCVQRFLASQTS